MRIAVLLGLLIAQPAGAPLAQEFDFLAVAGHRVATTHALPLRLILPPRLLPLGETHFRESYGGPSFDEGPLPNSISNGRSSKNWLRNYSRQTCPLLAGIRPQPRRSACPGRAAVRFPP